MRDHFRVMHRRDHAADQPEREHRDHSGEAGHEPGQCQDGDAERRDGERPQRVVSDLLAHRFVRSIGRW
jgi:hypothetical protein